MNTYKYLHIIIFERRPKPSTIWNSHTRTLILDTIMKLWGTIGVTQKTMTFETHVCLISLHTLIKSSGTMRDTWKTMTISATSFRKCNRFSPLLGARIYKILYIYKYTLYIHPKFNIAPEKWWTMLSFLKMHLPNSLNKRQPRIRKNHQPARHKKPSSIGTIGSPTPQQKNIPEKAVICGKLCVWLFVCLIACLF